MKKSQRLRPVQQLKQREERTQARKLAEIQSQLADSRRQLGELESYLQDYFSTVNNQQRMIHSATQLGQYQNFISKLKLAIEHQKEDIKQRESALKAQTKLWALSRSQLNSMDELIEKSRLQEAVEEEKKAQKQMDDRPFRGGGGFS